MTPHPFPYITPRLNWASAYPLFGSKFVPLHRSLIVLWKTSFCAVHQTQIQLGLEKLNRNGSRYPIPNHSTQKSPLDSISQSYGYHISGQSDG